MTPIDHPSCTHTFMPPPMTDDVAPLRVHVFDEGPGGHSVIRSFWKPTPEELAHLNANGVVALDVLGDQLPPVFVGVLA